MARARQNKDSTVWIRLTAPVDVEPLHLPGPVFLHANSEDLIVLTQKGQQSHAQHLAHRRHSKNTRYIMKLRELNSLNGEMEEQP